MLEKFKTSKSAQRTVFGFASLVVLIGLFTLAPVRALASDFLSLFRVEKFVVVDVEPERMQELAEAMENINVGQYELPDDPSEGTVVASLDEAAALVGFDPRAPEGYQATTIIVQEGQTATFTPPDVGSLRSIFSMMELDPNLLPDNIDGETFTFTTEAGVVQMFGDESSEQSFGLMQFPSPSIDGPEGVDMQALGNAMLQLLGMSEDEAARLSETIDWSSTMVLPLPSDLASVQEVEVDGATGLLFDAQDYHNPDTGEYREATGGALLWQKDGKVYVVVSQWLNNFQMAEIANSLK